MDETLKSKIIEWLGDQADAVGFAPVERYPDAPEKHHPTRVLPDARTVIVLAKAVPRGMLQSPGYNLHLLFRTYHSVYPYLDELSLRLSTWLETETGGTAAPIASFAPLVFHGTEPWGVLSLKHSAYLAGLGAFGRSGLMYHPRYGALLRLGAVVTSAALPGDPMIEGEPCPAGCEACHRACPQQAFAGGSFAKLKCLAATVKHAIYPIALKTEEGRQHLERVINTVGHNYWIDCDACLKACPLNQGPKRAAAPGG